MKIIIINIKKQYNKHQQIILYLFFGVCTTAINTFTYLGLYKLLNINNIISTIIAWFSAVIFAFVTNKIYVFKSYSSNYLHKMNEFISFFGCRFLTGILDVIIMWIAVDYLSLNSFIWKIISNLIVTIINYVASKLLIFKK